ncbi:unnamed protein product [marine sediment metagenome]|uniref:Uncharacterized protein n=1 Tax=marine sediment metagenome TaxID=412755 RepID=X1SNV4_9ZZZZ
MLTSVDLSDGTPTDRHDFTLKLILSRQPTTHLYPFTGVGSRSSQSPRVVSGGDCQSRGPDTVTHGKPFNQNLPA